MADGNIVHTDLHLILRGKNGAKSTITTTKPKSIDGKRNLGEPQIPGHFLRWLPEKQPRIAAEYNTIERGYENPLRHEHQGAADLQYQAG